MDKICGIYCIENKITKQYYIGSSININERFWHHKSDLKNNRHPNQYLQRSYNKYGMEQFTYSILEICSPEERVALENLYLHIFDCTNKTKAFNICPTFTGPIGMKHTEETKLKMSINNARYWKGKTKSPEFCELMSKSRKGKELLYRHKPLIQFGLDGTKIAEFRTLKDAMQLYGKGVWAAAIGKVKTSAGYIWKYQQDLNVQ